MQFLNLNTKFQKWGFFILVASGLLFFIFSSPTSANSLRRTIECNPTFGSGGLEPGIHYTSFEGNPLMVVVGENYDPAYPTQLVFYLHGDEGGYQFHIWDDPYWGTSPLVQFINERGLIYVSPQADYSDTSDGRDWYRWYGDNDGNGQLLENLLEDTYRKYNLCRSIAFGSGVSGGAVFYDGYFLSTRGREFPAFFDVMCGSRGWTAEIAPYYPYYNDYLDFLSDSDALSQNQLRYTIGTEDFLYDQTTDMIAYHKSNGVDVVENILEGVGHCAFDAAAYAIEYHGSLLDSITFTGMPATLTPTPTATPDTNTGENP